MAKRRLSTDFKQQIREHLEALDAMTVSGTVDLIEALRHEAAIERAAQELLGPLLWLLRNDGHSWTDIGKALGISKQAAQQRFGALLVAAQDRIEVES